MITTGSFRRNIVVAILGAIFATHASLLSAQTAVGIRVEYPRAQYVEVKSDDKYCITEITVHMRAANVNHYKVSQQLCRAHLQELSLQGESAVDLQNGTGSFGWELYVPFGRDEENFGDVAGYYVFVLGRDTVVKIETRKK